MKIKVTTRSEAEVEIELPFFSENEHELFAILSDSDSRCLFIIGDYILIRSSMVSSDYATALAANRITEEEFYEAWQGALEKLSLAPKLITKDEFRQKGK